MSTRKYASGYEKLKKRRKEEKLIESQKGSMDKFVRRTWIQKFNWFICISKGKKNRF